MAVLTCAEMLEQCLAGRETAWRHFVSEYLPFASAVVERHCPDPARRSALLREAMLGTRDDQARFFRDYHGQGEREFLLHLRDHVCRVLEAAAAPLSDPDVPLEWEAFDKAVAGLGPLERQAVWMPLVTPAAEGVAAALRVDPATVEAAQAKAQELLRAACDHWSADMLQANRRLLLQAARSRPAPDCPDQKVFIRLIDGQITWRARADLEHHLANCWPCIDRLCRFREVYWLSRQAPAVSVSERESLLQAAGLEPERPSAWKRLIGAR